jgi:hypothetical protein
MAIEVTPLGFQKPDGYELVREGDNVIATNAQKAEELLADSRGRLVQLESAAGFGGTGLDLADTVVNPLLNTATATRNKLDARYVNETDYSVYQAANTAALAGKVDKASVVNVRDYGVVLDGSVPTGAQLVNAISAANLLGLPLRLPAGAYSFDQVALPSGTIIEGAGRSTIIKQSVSTQPTFTAFGSQATLGNLSEDLLKGATTINIPQSWGLVPGDLILVCDTFSYAATDAGYKSGEMLEVVSSTGTAITVKERVRGSFSNTAGSYTVANGAYLVKLTPKKNVTLRNMVFTGHPSGTSNMLKFQYVDGVVMDNVSTTGAQAGFCQFDTCRKVQVTGGVLDGLVDNWATGSPGYGYIIKQSCYDVTVRGVMSTMARHAVTTIGGALGAPRRIHVDGLMSRDNSSTAAIDTHSSAEGVLITNCFIEGSANGIACRGRNMTVRGNKIRSSTSAGILVNEDGRDILIEGNDINGCATSGIRVGASNSAHNNVEITRNSITDSVGAGITAGPNQTDLRIIRNNIERANTYGIDVNAACADVLILDNLVLDVALTGAAPGINSTGTQTAGLFDIVGNVVKQKAASLMNRAVYTTRTQGRITGNRAFGTYASAGSEFYGATGVTLADNLLYA